MIDLDKDFLGKFAQKGVDICEPLEGFDKCPHEFKRCVDELICNHKKLKSMIKTINRQTEGLEDDGWSESGGYIMEIDELISIIRSINIQTQEVLEV